MEGMAIDQVPQLHVLSARQVPKPIDIDKTVICSPHELIAIVTQANDVVIYRLNGQIALTIKHPEASPYDDDDDGSDPHQVACMQWSPNGRFIAVAWTDGPWNVYETEKGEIVQKGGVATDDGNEPVHIVAMEWHSHDLSKKPANESLNGGQHIDADLPGAITLHDATAVLPHLSALPSHGLRAGAEGARFASQLTTEGIFSSSTNRLASNVDILSLYASDGSIRVLMDGASPVGTVQADRSPQPHLVGTSAGLVSICQDSGMTLHCSSLKLPLGELNSPLLHVLAHCTAQLNALTAYIQRATQCTSHDFTTGMSYPDRLIKSISMTLEDREDSQATLTSALIHLAMTGQFQADVLEWLADIVKDTGLKRWDASITGMYGAVQTHLHQHILPALERVAIAASKIRGFARFHQGSAAFAPEAALFDAILRTSDELRSKVLATLDICIKELGLWRAFARWLKMQIEIASATPGTKSAAEAEERECSNIDISKTMQYVQKVLRPGSALKSVLVPGAAQGKHEPTLATLVGALQNDVETAVQAITQWQGRLFSKPTVTQIQLPAAMQLRQVVSQTADSSATVCVLALHDHNLTILTTSDQDLSQAGKSPILPNTSTIEAVVDACLHQNGSKLLILRQAADDQIQLQEINLTTNQTLVRHSFDRQSAAKLLVSGRSGKEFCVVFDESGMAWQVLDLHASANPP